MYITTISCSLLLEFSAAYILNHNKLLIQFVSMVNFKFDSDTTTQFGLAPSFLTMTSGTNFPQLPSGGQKTARASLTLTVNNLLNHPNTIS